VRLTSASSPPATSGSAKRSGASMPSARESYGMRCTLAKSGVLSQESRSEGERWISRSVIASRQSRSPLSVHAERGRSRRGSAQAPRRATGSAGTMGTRASTRPRQVLCTGSPRPSEGQPQGPLDARRVRRSDRADCDAMLRQPPVASRAAGGPLLRSHRRRGERPDPHAESVVDEGADWLSLVGAALLWARGFGPSSAPRSRGEGARSRTSRRETPIRR
jgi:hypothetical protein